MNTLYTIVQLPPEDLRALIMEVVELQLRTLIPQLINGRNKEDPMDDFVSIEAASMLLHKSKPTLYRLLRNGVLTPHRIPGTKSILLSKTQITKVLYKSHADKK